MNSTEFKESNEYKNAVKKICSYSKGFVFTIPYHKMTQGQKKAMDIITSECINRKIIDSHSIGLNVTGQIVEESFIRL